MRAPEADFWPWVGLGIGLCVLLVIAVAVVAAVRRQQANQNVAIEPISLGDIWGPNSAGTVATTYSNAVPVTKTSEYASAAILGQQSGSSLPPSVNYGAFTPSQAVTYEKFAD